MRTQLQRVEGAAQQTEMAKARTSIFTRAVTVIACRNEGEQKSKKHWFEFARSI